MKRKTNRRRQTGMYKKGDGQERVAKGWTDKSMERQTDRQVLSVLDGGVAPLTAVLVVVLCPAAST